MGLFSLKTRHLSKSSRSSGPKNYLIRDSDWTKLFSVIVGGSAPEAPSQPITFDSTITKTYVVHESLFREASPFFEAAIGREWKEAEDRAVKLPEHTPEAFEIYLRWVYAHRILQPSPIVSLDNILVNVHNLSRAYVLGDVLLDPDFKDAIIDALSILCAANTWIPFNEAKYLYENTQKGALIQLWIVRRSKQNEDVLTTSMHEENSRKYLTVDFLCDIRELSDEWISLAPNDTCVYHEHGESKLCYKIKYGIHDVSGMD